LGYLLDELDDLIEYVTKLTRQQFSFSFYLVGPRLYMVIKHWFNGFGTEVINCDKGGRYTQYCPPPIQNLRYIFSMFCDVLSVINELVAEMLFGLSADRLELGNAIS